MANRGGVGGPGGGDGQAGQSSRAGRDWLREQVAGVQLRSPAIGMPLLKTLFEVTVAIKGGIPTGGKGKRLKWNGGQWVIRDGAVEVNLAGDFFSGYAFPGDKVVALRLHGDYYVIGNGTHYCKATTQGAINVSGNADVSTPAGTHTITVQAPWGSVDAQVTIGCLWSQQEHQWHAAMEACSTDT